MKFLYLAEFFKLTENTETITRYFEAWQKHDVKMLATIFDNNCEYEIDGKSGYSGISEITKYWQRNKKRQIELEVLDPHIYVDEGNSAKVAFCAVLTDIEQNQLQTVFGAIEFEFENAKIVKLSERYQVCRVKAQWRIFTQIHRLKGFLTANWQRLAHAHLPKWLSGAAFVVSILTAFFYFGINRLPDLTICVLSGSISPDCDVVIAADRASLQSVAYKNLGMLAAALLFIAPFVASYVARVKYGRVKTTELVREGQDLEIMRNRFLGAKALTIFAGDFSFAHEHADFFSIFRKLAAQGKLCLISEDTRASVVTGLGGSAAAESLVKSLETQDNIVFSSPIPIKCSIIRRWDGSEVLYRFDHGGSDGAPFPTQMCEVKRRGDITPVVDLIEVLAKRHLRPE
jgi:ketosteroid isomerase-like protein